MTFLQRIRRSFLAVSVLIILILTITLSFGTEPSFAKTSGEKPDVAITRKGGMVGKSDESQVQVDQNADQMKAKTLESIDRSIGKATTEKPDKQNEEVRESTQEMRREARDAFK